MRKPTILSRALRLTTSVLLVIGAAGCSAGTQGPPYEVTTTIGADESTRDIAVWAPDADGSWPVVLGFHGLGGAKEDWDVLAGELTAQGMVVFVPDWSVDSADNLACAFAYARAHATEHGGDPAQPFVVVGHSAGASIALVTLNDPPPISCVEPIGDHPDLVVGIAGCYYEYAGVPNDFDAASYGNRGTPIVLIGGDRDEICPTQQSEDAAAALRAAGHDTTFVSTEDADHFNLIFHEIVDGEFVTLADDPAGLDVVQTIVDAVAAVR
jgi:alpha-beta hydrolase superfamily lysophospholipase